MFKDKFSRQEIHFLRIRLNVVFEIPTMFISALVIGGITFHYLKLLPIMERKIKTSLRK